MNNYIKYPRTPHLPYSDGITNDDRILKDISHLETKTLIATIKMDGENTTLYNDHIHARSLDSKDHTSRHWVKGLWSSIRNDIPEKWRICGENLFAKHSIEYLDLDSYFYVFNIWNEDNICLSYEDTILWCELLGLTHVPLIRKDFLGTEVNLKELHTFYLKEFSEKHEGYVIRSKNSFNFSEFYENYAKYVRKNHVQTDSHWMFQNIVSNKLK